MKHRRTLSLLVSFLLALLALAPAESAHAQLPDLEEAVVYGVTATTPDEVLGTLSPPQVEEICLLAGRANILSPRRTRIFYWPLTKEYRAAWSRLNEPLDGVLEILRRGRVVKTVTSEPYTTHYKAAGTTTGRLYVGDEALAADTWFHETRDAYQQAVHNYEQAYEAWLGLAQAGRQPGADQPFPPEPQPPTSLTVFSIGLHEGFPVELTAGTYQIRMRGLDGRIVDGSQRTLRVFAPRQSLLGYEVIPEERWTFPDQANAPTEAVLAKAGCVIYLRPRVAHEYPALAYERLRNAQYAGETREAWRWVAQEDDAAFANAELEILRGDVVEERVENVSFFVNQASDQAAGYEIIPFDPDTPDLTPRVDFSGFRLELPPGRDSFAVRLRSPLGTPYAGSTRQVRVMPEGVFPILVPMASIVVAFGLAMLTLPHRFSAPVAKADSATPARPTSR